MAKSGAVKKVNLALQGGGAHGAFTWGVLERLLAEEHLDVEAITATSAGAVNAVIVAQGMLEGGPDRAREMLSAFWRSVSTAASMSPLQPSIVDKLLGNVKLEFSPSFMALDFLSRIFSPYQFNLLDLNPLRSILEEVVDFDRIRKNKEIKLFVNATHVRSGRVRVFKTHEVTLDVVMASTCLPFLFKTVEVDGEPYWDGGYSGNPSLFPLFYHCNSDDVILVQINPLFVEEVPTTASDILDRVNEISFNGILIDEMRAIHFVHKLLREHNISEEKYKYVNVHMIEANDLMAPLGRASKLNADWDFLRHLRDIGIQTAGDWLEAHFDDIGVRPTVDIEKTFL